MSALCTQSRVFLCALILTHLLISKNFERVKICNQVLHCVWHGLMWSGTMEYGVQVAWESFTNESVGNPHWVISHRPRVAHTQLAVSTRRTITRALFGELATRCHFSFCWISLVIQLSLMYIWVSSYMLKKDTSIINSTPWTAIEFYRFIFTNYVLADTEGD